MRESGATRRMALSRRTSQATRERHEDRGTLHRQVSLKPFANPFAKGPSRPAAWLAGCVLYALNVDAGTVADEMGHTGPELAFRVYRHAMRRDEGENAALRALVEGGELANSGQRSENGASAPVGADAA
jgi:integrase